MSQPKINQIIDYRQLALKKKHLSGQISQSVLHDLKTVLSTQANPVDYRLNFELKNGLCFISGVVETVLDLLCLRCLKPMHCQVNSDIKLVVIEPGAEFETGKKVDIKAENKAPCLPAGYEDYEVWVIADKALSVEAVITEELILSVPLDSRHNQRDCDLVSEEIFKQEIKIKKAEKNGENPFAKVRELF